MAGLLVSKVVDWRISRAKHICYDSRKVAWSLAPGLSVGFRVLHLNRLVGVFGVKLRGLSKVLNLFHNDRRDQLRRNMDGAWFHH
jgi:hypothetical protein